MSDLEKVVGGIPGAAEVAAAWERWSAYESNFDGWHLIYWIRANWTLPLICCGMYMSMVFVGPYLMKGGRVYLCRGLSPLRPGNLAGY